MTKPTPRGPKTTLDPVSTIVLFNRAVTLGRVDLANSLPRDRYKYYRAWRQSPWGMSHSLTIKVTMTSDKRCTLTFIATYVGGPRAKLS